MDEPGRMSDKAAELAASAAAAAKPIKDKAVEVAATAAAAAGPLAASVKMRAAGLADKAGELGAKGISAVAEGIDSATGGKVSDRIASVSSRIEKKLDPEDPTPGSRRAGP